MPNRTTEELNFRRLGRRHLQANCDGGDLSSDGGLMLLRQIDARTGLSRLAAKALTERRASGRIRHRLRDIIAQRLYGLCCGYEDLNDHDTLRSDLLMQTAVGCDQPLASSPTLSRLETGATRADAWALHQVLIEHFIASFATAPTELTLDVDASDIPLHGEQELKRDYQRTGLKQRLVTEFRYAAASWNTTRRVLTRLEYGAQGVNPRFVVTNIANSDADAMQLYDQLYCARGEAENRIKEAQLDLFGTRASCHRFAANQFRVLLAAPWPRNPQQVLSPARHKATGVGGITPAALKNRAQPHSSSSLGRPARSRTQKSRAQVH